jgi:SAM-dependent methyltransferase
MTHSLLTRNVRRALGRPPDLIDYWDRRAAAHGRRAVLNISHSEDEFDVVTEFQKGALFPQLESALEPDDRVVLDFGCGPGRFTPALAELVHGTAIGIDPVRHLLDLAPRRENVTYLLSDGRVIPLPDSSVDVVWVCLVLGGIRELDPTIAELERVARPGALFLVAENTSELGDLDHWFYRSVEDYQDAFGRALVLVDDYVDEDERISVLRGRI